MASEEPMTEWTFYVKLAAWLAEGDDRSETNADDYRRARLVLVWLIAHPQAVQQVAADILSVKA